MKIQFNPQLKLLIGKLDISELVMNGVKVRTINRILQGKESIW